MQEYTVRTGTWEFASRYWLRGRGAACEGATTMSADWPAWWRPPSAPVLRPKVALHQEPGYENWRQGMQPRCVVDSGGLALQLVLIPMLGRVAEALCFPP